MRFPDFIEEALGATRIQQLASLEGRIGDLHRLTVDASTTEIILVPMTKRKARTWRRLAEQRGEDWVFITSTDGETVLAVDEPSDLAGDHPADAVVFPELHTRLIAWWLVHAWRGIDLYFDTLESLRLWRITSAAVTARALIEEAGCLAHESVKLADAWHTAKATRVEGSDRASAIRAALSPALAQASFGTRTEELSTMARATNVLTYVTKLAKATGDDRFASWYDWLSDAAHPAFGARIALASAPLGHDSNAVMVRSYMRSPMSFVDEDGQRKPSNNLIASHSADALAACGLVMCDVLDQTLAIIDDFGLTTKAATFTQRRYWRDFQPVRGGRPCPCGRGKWSTCPHRWDKAAVPLHIPRTAP